MRGVKQIIVAIYTVSHKKKKTIKFLGHSSNGFNSLILWTYPFQLPIISSPDECKLGFQEID